MHEIWKIHLEIASRRIMICQDTIVDELPSKSVGNDDDDAFRRRAFWFGDISIQPVDFVFTAQGHAGVDVAAEAVWARHLFIGRDKIVRIRVR